MFYYVLSFISYYFGLLSISKLQNKKSSIVFFFAAVPMFLLVMLRGDVGTDTLSYLDIISRIEEDFNVDIEIGFTFLVKFFLLLGFNSRLIILCFALMTTAILLRMAVVSQRSLIILIFCVVPVFYLDMTMNGLRYGLSFALAGVSVSYFYKEKWILTILLASCSVLIHVSSLIIFIIMLMLSNDQKEFKLWLKIILCLIFLVFLQFASGGVIAGAAPEISKKITAYSHFKSPSVLSGLAPLGISVLSLIFIKLLQQEVKGNTKVFQRQFYTLLIFVFLTFVIAKLSYAGLRMQYAVLYTIFTAIQFKPNYINDISFNMEKKYLYMILIIGILGVVSFLKYAYLSNGQLGSPWLPYKINSNISNYFLAL